MTPSTRQLAQIVSGVSVLALAAAGGLLAQAVSPIATLGICAIGSAALMVIAIRRLLPRNPGEPESVDTVDGQPGGQRSEGAELRLARLLFYLGSLTVGQSALRFGAGFTLSEAMFIAAFGACLLAALRGQPVIGMPAPVLVMVTIFVFGGAISSVGAQSPSGSAYQVLHAVYVLLLWPCVGAMVLRTRRQVMTAIVLWSTSAAIDGLDAIAQLTGVHVLGPARQGNRMTGLTENPNDLGGVTSVALVPALLCATQAGAHQLTPRRLFRWVTLVLVVVGLVLSGSVAGMAAAAAALLAWLSSPLVRASARGVVLATLVCALAVVVAGSARVTSPVQRLVQVTSPASGANNGSGQDRISVAEQAWPRIKSDPIVGAGLDNNDSFVTIISHAYSVPYQIHGLPLAAWYESGIFGVVGLIGLIGVLGALGWKGVGTGTSDDELRIGWALLAAFLAFVIEAMTQPMVFQQYGWITGVMLLAWLLRAQPAVGLAPAPGGPAALGRQHGVPRRDHADSRPAIFVTSSTRAG
jgi:O-antigen ligase